MKYQMKLHRDNIDKFIDITDKLNSFGFSHQIKNRMVDDYCVVYLIIFPNYCSRTWNDADKWNNEKYSDHKQITWEEFLEMFDEKQTKEFKVGDKVYCPNSGSKIYTLTAHYSDKNLMLAIGDNTDKSKYAVTNSGYAWSSVIAKLPIIFHATQENYELLSKLHPNIKFQPPKKYLQGSELCRKKLKDGEKLIVCYVGNTSDEMSFMIKTTAVVVGENGSGQFITMSGGKFNSAVPLANKDEILKEEITDE